MNFDFLHDTDQLLSILDRIYRLSMTVILGGNITICITPDQGR